MRQTFWNSSLILVAVAVCLSPLVVFLALPWIDLGIFRQVETVAFSLHLVAALAALGLMGVSIARPEALRGIAGWPVWTLLGLSAASIALSPFAIEGARTLHGSLEHGVGAAWFAELAVLTAAATVLRREWPAAFRVACLSGVAAVLGCFGLEMASLRFAGERLVPYDFQGYLGFTALLAAVPLLALRPGSRPVLLAVLGLCAVAVYGNRTAILTLVAAGVMWWALVRFGPVGRRLLTACAAVFLIGGVLAIGALSPVVERALSGAPRVASIPSERALDHVEVQTKPYGTLWQRSVTEGVVWDALLSHPRRILTGMGFGAFETVAIAERAEAPGRIFVTHAPTASLAYWDGDQKAKFHSHNLWLETLLSAGIAGAVAWFAFVVSIPGRAPRTTWAGAALLVSVLTISGGLWFFVNSAMPLFALALASVAPGVRLPRKPVVVGPREAGATLGFALALGGAAFLGAAAFASAKGQILERFFPPQIAGPAGPACAGFSAVSMPNRQINVNLYRMFVRRVEDRKDLAMVELAPRLGNAANFSCMMRQYVETSNDVEALETSLSARTRLNAVLGAGNPIMERALAPDFVYWDRDLDRWLDLAPGRTDLLLPYFAWLGTKGDRDRLVKALDHFAGRMGDADPVKAYALGLKARETGDVDGSRDLMRKAFRLGIANLTPVSEAVLADLTGSAP